MANRFYVLAEVKSVNLTEIESANATYHFAEERRERVKLLAKELKGESVVTSFIVDKGHWNGYEQHIIFSNGIILIVNEESRKLITMISSGATRLQYYWNDLGIKFPQNLYKMLPIAERTAQKIRAEKKRLGIE